MGTVYDIVDTTIGKRYVLKTLHPQLGARDDLGRRLLREARTLGRLNHANIVEVITAGVTSDEQRLPYYVMERLNGQSLRMVLEKKGQLELPHAYQIGIDLLDALDHAHGEGVIHRDIKPDNIFLHRTLMGVTVTKLIDFGIQALIAATTRETAGRFLGTLRYAAPEQLRGDPATPSVDVYAAGLVMYEMVAGRGPFDEAAEPHAIGAAHIDKPPPALSTFASVPPALDELVMSALAKDPAVRPRDAFSFATSLRDLKRALPGPKVRSSGAPRSASRIASAAIDGDPQASAPRSIVTPRPQVVAPRAESTTPHGIPAVVPTSPAPPSVAMAPSVDARVAAAVMTPRPNIASVDSTERDLAPGSDGAPFRWPDERFSGSSEQPQVRTLSAGMSKSSRSGLRMMTMFAFATVATLWGAVRVERDFASRRAAALSAPLLPMAAAVQASPKPELSSLPPAVSAAPAASIALASSAEPRPVASSAPAPRKKAKSASPAASAAKALLSEIRTDRPGPGF